MHHESNCIVCYRVCPITNNTETKTKRNSKSQLLDNQLTAIFIVAQLLEIPRSFCQNLLLQSGNPSEWITGCQRCNELIDNAYKTFKEVHQLQKKYVDLKSTIKTRLLNSRSQIAISYDNSVMKTTNDIRKFVFKDLPPENCKHKLNEDVPPDRSVLKSDPDIILKVENDIDIHEEDHWNIENIEEEHKLTLSQDIFEPSAVNEGTKEFSNSRDTEECEDQDSDGNFQQDDANDGDWEEADKNSDTSDSENEEGQGEGSTKATRINKEGKNTCDDCGKKFLRPHLLKRHITLRHRRNLPYNCVKCNISYNNRDSLSRHNRRKHPKDKELMKNIPTKKEYLKNMPKAKVKCDVCGQSLSKDFLAAHKLTHSENSDSTQIKKKFECEHCGLNFLKPSQLVKHKATRHKENFPYKCLNCKYSFKNRDSLSKHYRRKHPKDKEVMRNIPTEKADCDICGKSYVEDYMKTHKLTHSEDKTNGTESIKKYTCDYCGWKFLSPSKLQGHIACRHKKNYPNKCGKCKLSFKGWDGLKKHYRLKHPEDTEAIKSITPAKIPCKICGQMYSETYIETHMLTHSEVEQNKLKCDICNLGFKTDEELEVHQRGLHHKELNLEPYECKECEKTFESDKWLVAHNILIHKIGELHICPFCDKPLAHACRLKNHIEMVHKSEKFPCDQCSKICNTKARLEIHVTTQHATRYECEICQKVFARADFLRYHRRGKHYQELNLEPINCDECGKIFTCHKSLGQHAVKQHTKDFKEFCSICNRGFYNKHELSLHIRKEHEKEKNFTCSYCGMAFFAKTHFDAHTISQHTKEFAATCEICGHGSATEGIHRKHMKIHGDRTYTCELCGEAYKFQYDLTDHQRGKHYQELGLEPFKCTECDKICNTRSSLNVHVTRDHTEFSKLPCSYCTKQFMTKAKLADHVRRHHTGEKPHKCHLCGDAFFTKQEKLKHAEIHNVD